MANIYEYIEQLKADNGKRYKKTVLYHEMKQNPKDRYIISIQNDRLDNLAYKYYQDARLWWILARANNLGKGDLNIPIGIQLRIPYNHLSIVEEYNTLNQ